ncbi:MAG: SprB repeat-containing protein [Bacteroidia bacterium]|nr:SprB repeat-containing protein [Bacteroidia bacterium]
MRMFTNFLRSSKISVSDVRLLGFIVPVFLLLVSFQVSNAQLSVSVTVQTALMCNGDTNGALQANPDGGTAPYSYHWSNGVSTQIASNLVAETYNVTVTDHNSNTASTSYTLTQPTELAISFTSHPVTCYGGSDGEITASVSGGISPYFYLWGNGNTTDSLSGLPYGEYGITVFDANSCVVQSSFLLTQSLQIKIFQSGILNILCNGASTGYIHITYTGGVSPYQFLWTGGYTTQNIDNVPAGNYTVTLTDSNGCKATKAFTLTQTAVINPVITPVNVVCSADLTGSLSDSITGGTSPYSYTWSTGATTKNISGLGTGTYRVTVTDSNNCKNTASASIIATSLMTFSLQKTDETCYGLNDGSATVNISSGNPVYSYHWSNSGSTATISGLPIGSYNVTVTDGNGCPFVSSSVQIVGPTQIQYSTTVTDVTCNSGSDGAVQLSVSGGTSPYTFAWGNNATTQNISGLHAGDYQVTIYDNNNCNTTTSVTVNQPPALMASLSASNASCYLYNVALSVSGGSTGYSYYWSDFSSSTGLSGVLAGHYSVTVTDSHQCTVTAGISITQPDTLKVTVSGYQNVDCRGNSNGYVHITVTGGTTGYQYSWSNFATTQNIDGISGGTYSVTVTDAKGCVATAQQIINEPASGITAILNVTNVNCHGNSTGAIDLIPSGGTSPYSFLWNNGSTDEDLSGIPAGPYSVAVKDTDNCIYYFSTEVEQPEADLVISNFNVTNINCHGNHNGIVTINVTGGTIPYYYSWSNGATSQNLLGLGPDTYSVVVTDNLGCTTSGSYQVSQPDTLVAGSTYGNILCHGGTTNISVSATGGVAPYSGTGTFTVNAGPYSYTVTDANLCTSITSGSINEPGQLYIDLSASPSSILCNGGTSTITIGAHGGVPPYQGTGDSTVTAGGYLYTVYDSNGCPASGTIQVTEPGVLNISVSANPNPLLCHGDSATVTVTASYGTPPYTGTGIFKEIAGTYSYTVTDNNGCSASQNLTITQPDALVAGSTYGNILCNVRLIFLLLQPVVFLLIVELVLLAYMQDHIHIVCRMLTDVLQLLPVLFMNLTNCISISALILLQYYVMAAPQLLLLAPMAVYHHIREQAILSLPQGDIYIQFMIQTVVLLPEPFR